MMRTPRYKFTRCDDGGGELYDLDRDPDELENRLDAPEYATMRAQLSRQLNEWAREYPHRT